MKKPIIAIDMDDVMAAASKKILATYNNIAGAEIQEQDFVGKAYFDVLDKKHTEGVMAEFFKPGFFRDMEVMPHAVEVIQKLHSHFEIYVVSAATEFPYSLKEKIDWLAEHFSFISWKNIVLCGDKSIIAADYLIDDHEKNLKPFRGKSLLFDAIHNQTLEGYPRFRNWKEIEVFFDEIILN